MAASNDPSATSFFGAKLFLHVYPQETCPWDARTKSMSSAPRQPRLCFNANNVLFRRRLTMATSATGLFELFLQLDRLPRARSKHPPGEPINKEECSSSEDRASSATPGVCERLADRVTTVPPASTTPAAAGGDEVLARDLIFMRSLHENSS